jgi:chaperone modulatory protein CbpM
MTERFQLLDDETMVALEELLEASGLAREEVAELVEFGIFEPAVAGERWFFSSRCIIQARRAARLRDDFGINPPGMALALAYLERIEALERQLRELECQLLK